MSIGSHQQDTVDMVAPPLAPGSADGIARPKRGFFRQFPAAVAAMRPRQWSKNGLVLLALVFAHRLTDLSAVGRVLMAFFAFSLAASAVYIVNDIADREKDRVHPRKRLRPIASGRLSILAFVSSKVRSTDMNSGHSDFPHLLRGRATFPA